MSINNNADAHLFYCGGAATKTPIWNATIKKMGISVIIWERIAAVFAEYEQEVSHGEVFYTGTANNCAAVPQIRDPVSIHAFWRIDWPTVHGSFSVHRLLRRTARSFRASEYQSIDHPAAVQTH